MFLTRGFASQGYPACKLQTEPVREDELVAVTGSNTAHKDAADQGSLLLVDYHRILRQQAISFWCSIAAAGVGFGFFIVTVVLILTMQPNLSMWMTGIGGVLVEVLTGLFYNIYKRTNSQLTEYRQHLILNRGYQLGDSICDKLKGELQRTLAGLVYTIANSKQEQAHIERGGDSSL